MNGKIYLLTGATGLLGGNILRELVERGAHIRTLVLPGDKAAASIPKDVEIVTGGLLDDEALELFFDVPQTVEAIVIHAASIVTIDPKFNEAVRAVNVDGTKNILSQCLKHNIKKLVYVSSTGVIPEAPKGQKIREAREYDPDLVTGCYAKTKAEATNLVLKAAREEGLNASIVYPSGIFGPHDYGFGLITSCIKMVAEGKLRIAIGGTFNSADVRDLADGILACAQKGRRGETYIMSGGCHTFSELIEIIRTKAGMKKQVMTVPLWLVRPFAEIGTLYARITGKTAWLSRYNHL